VFSSWTGCDTPAGNVCTMAMNGNKDLVANFATPPPPPPPPAPFTVALNGSSFSTGQTLIATVTLDPAISGPAPVDAYITIQTPGGQVFSVLLPIGANLIVPGTVPIATNFAPFAVSAPVITTPLGGIPPGTYTFQTMLTQPGTMTPVGSPGSASFTFTP
jgi:hypothetical protein